MLRTWKVDRLHWQSLAYDFALDYRFSTYGNLDQFLFQANGFYWGFYPKNNVADCHFGMRPEYYTNSFYDPLPLTFNGQSVSRTCNGEEISKAVNFLNANVQMELEQQITNFIARYVNNDNVAGFSFASGTNQEKAMRRLLPYQRYSRRPNGKNIRKVLHILPHIPVKTGRTTISGLLP